MPEVTFLREEDAYTADPEAGYGWEKLFTEELCRYYRQDYRMETRIVRIHNVYDPLGTYEGGKEKAPAAIPRKVALANCGDEIEIWGDGEQTRSFMYVNDCVEGLLRLMASEYAEPLNLGTDRLISINELVDVIARLQRNDSAKGKMLPSLRVCAAATATTADCANTLGWEPTVSLEDGLRVTYRWIEEELRQAGRIPHECATHSAA